MDRRGGIDLKQLFCALVLILCTVVPVSPQEVVADLSQRGVSITANFDGSEIMIFGAVKRDAPLSEQGPVDVIVTVSGPDLPVTVRKKDRVAGIWVNNQTVEVDAAPSLYKIATTIPFGDAISDTADLRHQVSIPRAIRSVGAPDTVEDSVSFTEALIRIRTDSGLYSVEEGAVTLVDQTLFNTRIALPANLVEGTYRARILLLRDKDVVATYGTNIDVRKVGLERFIYNLAHERPLVYGIFSLAIAITAGWGASAIFRYIQT